MPAGRPPTPIAERFHANVETAGECWIWTAVGSAIWNGEKSMPAARWAYETIHGAQSSRYLRLARTCGNARCVRPEHLAAVPPSSRPPPKRSPEAAFWARVEKAAGDGCWVWTGATKAEDGHKGGGYGVLWRNGRQVRAHRYAYEITHGPLHRDMLVLHGCHNRRCVRPDHLHLGTHQDNMREMAEAGRAARGTVRGEQVGNAKLTAERVRLLRALYRELEPPQEDLAKLFGVARSSVSQILSGRTWAHLDE